MFNFCLIIIAGIGITNLIVNATILDKLREFLVYYLDKFGLGKLLTCMMCSGFWVGISISIGFEVNVILGAAITSLGAHIVGLIIEYLDLETIRLSNKIAEEDDE